MGNVLPNSVVSALSVGLYGMFLAIIIPPARKNKIIAVLVMVSMALSFVFSKLPLLSSISSGMRVIVLTVLISLAAAILFPREEEDEDAV
jgi:predicted branched-subunit amino acid permease